MCRTKIKDRELPDYTKGEEIFNMVSHIVGGGFGIIALLYLLIISDSVWDVVGSSIYGGSLIVLYTMSSVYHGLGKNTGKKVLQVLDHCTIYGLIAGTYTPILLSGIRPMYPVLAFSVLAAEWGLTALAVTFTAIDLKKYSVFSMVCYIVMGWLIILAAKPTIQALTVSGFLWVLAGGISYTIGAVCYGLGKKKRYMHSIFHLFVVAGSILQFVGIAVYVV